MNIEDTIVTIDLSEYKKDIIDKLKIAMMTTAVLMVAVVTLGIMLLNVDGGVVMTQVDTVKEMQEQWAVLVAGSKGWDNYRHQADVCHAYQVLHEHGVDDDHIVVMMYDDIAYSHQNPTKGVIINKPEGPNVYKGVPKDYTGENVNPQNFLAVLKGDKKAVEGKGSGKVVQSGPNDNVFVYFADHGASGIVAFPSDFLDAQTLNAALQEMNKNKRYKQVLFYLEACEAGSMFEGLLPQNIGVLAVTASNSTAPSFACFYDDKLKTFLGDVFSVSWMQNADAENIEKETVEQQIDDVSNSTVIYGEIGHFGDGSIMRDMVGMFQGPKDSGRSDTVLNITDAVAAYQVPIARLEKNTESNTEEIHSIKKGRKFVDTIVEDIAYEVLGDSEKMDEILEETHEIRDFDCFIKAVRVFHQKCFNLGENGFALRKVHILANLCGSEVLHVNSNDNYERIKNVISNICTHPKIVGIN